MKNIIIGLSTMLALCGAHKDGDDTTEMRRERHAHTLSNMQMTLSEFIKDSNPDRLNKYKLDESTHDDSDQIPGQVPFSREVSKVAFDAPDDRDRDSVICASTENTTPRVPDRTKQDNRCVRLVSLASFGSNEGVNGDQTIPGSTHPKKPISIESIARDDSDSDNLSYRSFVIRVPTENTTPPDPNQIKRDDCCVLL